MCFSPCTSNVAAEKCDAESAYCGPSTLKVDVEKFDIESTYCAPFTSKVVAYISDTKHASNNKSAQKLKNTTST